MHFSNLNLRPLAWLLCVICAACFLAGCETTDQERQAKVMEANRGANHASDGELSAPLEAVNALGDVLSKGAGVHGTF
jgi:hypothetical protein